MRKIAADFDNFTPLFDLLVQEMGIVTAAVYGRIWRYCQMEDNVCKASQETIAAELGISRRTVIRSTDDLISKGFLRDLTPELRNRPHVLADSGKLSITVRFGTVEQKAGVTESHSEIKDQQNGVTESHSTVTESHSRCDRESQPTVTQSHMNQSLLRDSLRDSVEETAQPTKSDALVIPPKNIWDQVLKQFQGQCDRADYRTWLMPINPISWDGKTLTLGVANSYAHDLVKSRYAKLIDRNLTGITGAPDAHAEIIVRGPNG